MFQGWGFLLGEIWGLIALSALVGLIAGWLMRGRAGGQGDPSAAEGLRADLAGCRAGAAEAEARLAALSADLAAAQAEARRQAALAAEAFAAAEPDAAMGPGVGSRPRILAAPRFGVADDLQQIRGIGPKLEALCNRLGFWHLDQIAAWSAEEIAWVDANLEAFKGRVTRDDWVTQARALTESRTGGQTGAQTGAASGAQTGRSRTVG